MKDHYDQPLSGRTRLATAVVLAAVLALAGGAYIERQDIRDFIWRRRQGSVPTALTLEQIRSLRKKESPAAETAPPKPPVMIQKPAAVPAPETAPATSAPAAPPAENTGPAADNGPLTADAARPDAINLLVPMVYQAPLTNWDTTHEDACEEASMLMAQAFLTGEKTISRKEMDRRILDLIDYEMKALGYFESTDAATTAAVMRGHLGLTGIEVLPVRSIDDVKAQLAEGRPVLLPADGKALKNPNFRHGGPLYHMLVAKGYKPGQIIANDPGTRLGADYIYDEEVLFGAIHDWNGGDPPHGEKLMIVVK